jgi:hypothetical protein
MPNINPLIARLVEKFDQDREEIYWWMDGLCECGFEVPSGKALRILVANREKRQAREGKEHDTK